MAIKYDAILAKCVQNPEWCNKIEPVAQELLGTKEHRKIYQLLKAGMTLEDFSKYTIPEGMDQFLWSSSIATIKNCPPITEEEMTKAISNVALIVGLNEGTLLYGKNHDHTELLQTVKRTLEVIDSLNNPKKTISIESSTISEIQKIVPDPLDNLIGNHWLYKGSYGVIVAPSGHGKSTLLLQIAMAWGAGKPIFGLRPARPLNVAVWQYENCDWELAAMTIPAGTSDKVRVIKQAENKDRLLEQIRLFCISNQTDIIILDPLLALGQGNASDQEQMGIFLREKLLPLLRQLKVGCWIIHHTPKRLVTSELSSIANSAFGSVEIINACKACLVLQKDEKGGVMDYTLSVAKRAKECGVKEWDGSLVFNINISKSIQGLWVDGGIRLSTVEQEVTKLLDTYATQLRAALAVVEPQSKNGIIEKAMEVTALSKSSLKIDGRAGTIFLAKFMENNMVPKDGKWVFRV